MKKVQRALVLFFTAVVLGSGAYVLYSLWSSPAHEILFPQRDVAFGVEVLRSEQERAQGLSGRRSLNSDRGMWFVLDSPATHSFWMKDMHIPIDIIWLNGQKQIVGIEHSVQPPPPDIADEQLPRYTSPPGTEYALEINAGIANETGLEKGDQAVERRRR